MNWFTRLIARITSKPGAARRSSPPVTSPRQAPASQTGGLIYVMILKAPPEPPNKKWYVSQVLKSVCPELTPGVPVNMQVTGDYRNEACIATAASFGAARNGIAVDMDKVRIQAFADAEGGRGTVIKCYK